jgi:uncharacterized protein
MKQLAALFQLGLGALFGVALVRTGTSDFDAMLRMLLFQESNLFALGAATTVLSALGLAVILRSKLGEGVRATPRPIHRGTIPGGIIFGLGWGLSGSCPGTALAQLGSGHVVAAFTISGIFLGNWLFDRYFADRFGLSRTSCS